MKIHLQIQEAQRTQIDRKKKDTKTHHNIMAESSNKKSLKEPETT